MFSVKPCNKFVFLFSFFLINFFLGADDALRKQNDHAQKSKKLLVKSVQQDQENKFSDHFVEIILPASMQKLKDRAQELVATFVHRQDVQDTNDKITAVKKRLQRCMLRIKKKMRPSFDDDMSDLYQPLFLTPILDEDSLDLQESTLEDDLKGIQKNACIEVLAGAGVWLTGSSAAAGGAGAIAGAGATVGTGVALGTVAVGSTAAAGTAAGVGTVAVGTLTAGSVAAGAGSIVATGSVAAMGAAITTTAVAGTGATLTAVAAGGGAAVATLGTSVALAVVVDKLQNKEKTSADSVTIPVAIAIAIPLLLPVALPELTKCQLFKQKLAIALAAGGRSDLRLIIDQDLFCKEEFLDKNKKLEDDEKLSGLKSVAYLGNAVSVLELSECVGGAAVGVISNIGSQSTGAKKGWFTESQYAEKILNFPKHCKESRLRFLERTKSPEEIKEYAKIWFNKIYQLSPMARKFPPDQLVSAYSGFAETHFVIVLQDYEGLHHGFVIPYNDRLPAYLLPTDLDVWQKQVDLEKRVEESDKKYAEILKKRQKNLEKLDKNYDDIATKLKDNAIPSREDQLPKDFDPEINKNGKFLRNKKGDYFNKKGEQYSWDVDKNQWEIIDLHGNKRFCPPTLPMAAIPPQKPQILDHRQPDAPDLSQGCRIPIPEQDGPTILTTPQDEEPKRENPGCGSTDPIQLPTHTGGCGENVQTPEEKREQLILHAEIGDLSDVDVKFREDNIKHIFDDRVGHVVDTPENREIIMDLVKNFENFKTKDKHGKLWYGKFLPNGKQLWAHVINDLITNCGINDTPVVCDPDTGFSTSNKPQQK